MKWTFHELGLMAPLSWAEWSLMACVFGIGIFAGWQAMKFARMILKGMRGE